MLDTLSLKISGGTIKIGGVIKGRTWCGRTEYLTEGVRVKITKVNDLTGSFRVDRTWVNNSEGTGAGKLQSERNGTEFDWVWNSASSEENMNEYFNRIAETFRNSKLDELAPLKWNWTLAPIKCTCCDPWKPSGLPVPEPFGFRVSERDGLDFVSLMRAGLGSHLGK